MTATRKTPFDEWFWPYLKTEMMDVLPEEVHAIAGSLLRYVAKRGFEAGYKAGRRFQKRSGRKGR